MVSPYKSLREKPAQPHEPGGSLSRKQYILKVSLKNMYIFLAKVNSGKSFLDIFLSNFKKSKLLLGKNNEKYTHEHNAHKYVFP